MTQSKLTAVTTFNSRMEADMAADRMRAEGIDAVVATDDAGGAHPELQLTSGVRLLVPAAQREAAEALLAAVMSEPLPEPGTGATPPREPSPKPGFGWFALLIVFIAGTFFGHCVAGYANSPRTVGYSDSGMRENSSISQFTPTPELVCSQPSAFLCHALREAFKPAPSKYPITSRDNSSTRRVRGTVVPPGRV